MKREEHERAKEALAAIHHSLETEPLTKQQREQLEYHAAALSGSLFSTWLPVSTPRRLIMLGIIALGLQQAWWYSNYQPLLWWLLLPAFSPRIVGETDYALGRFSRGFK